MLGQAKATCDSLAGYIGLKPRMLYASRRFSVILALSYFGLGLSRPWLYVYNLLALHHLGFSCLSRVASH